jgi:hypothetical protein
MATVGMLVAVTTGAGAGVAGSKNQNTSANTLMPATSVKPIHKPTKTDRLLRGEGAEADMVFSFR